MDWGGFVYRNRGKYYATETEGPEGGGEVTVVFGDLPSGAVPVGDWHTHGTRCNKAGDEDFSRDANDDITQTWKAAEIAARRHRNSERGQSWMGWLGTPKGDFLSYDTADGKTTRYPGPGLMPNCPCK